MSRGAVYPELVTGRQDGVGAGAWRVREGSTRRGEASCDLVARVLEVPLGGDQTARAVRAHELMHARVSPCGLDWPVQFPELAPRALECAEELRVNTLLARLGFPVEHLRDGTEKGGGRRLGEEGDWAQAVCFLLAVLGTGAERDYLAGVRAAQPTWPPAMRAIRHRVLEIVGGLATSSLGATDLTEESVPRGYARSTVLVARLVTPLMNARVPVGAEALRAFRRSLAPGGRRPPTGRFAAVVVADLARGAGARTGAGRRRQPAVTGTVLTYPQRLLTDPRRRAFTRPARGRGGVVVIDQSGSMDLGPDQLAQLLRRAPDALVVGYSHRPGDVGATPNLWVLADRGSVAHSWPAGNVGNGVDGPALRWALARRRGREPVAWVTDGQVTDAHDHPDEALTAECAQLVRRHGVRLVRDVAGIARSLAPGPLVRPHRLADFGRVGRKLLESKGDVTGAP
ncbi:MAG: hypothetical protein ACHQFZ_11035 [Acidimicrobiales bacterium]